MVKLSHTPVTNPAMLGPEGPHYPARVTQPEDIRTSGTLPLIVVRNLLDGPVVVVRVLGQETGISLVGYQQANPHDHVDHNEGVMGLWQGLPGHRDAPEEVHGVGPQQGAADEEQQRPLRPSRLTKDKCPGKYIFLIF
jgi:hypothetical protein